MFLQVARNHLLDGKLIGGGFPGSLLVRQPQALSSILNVIDVALLAHFQLHDRRRRATSSSGPSD
jgi:hypothetical protein